MARQTGDIKITGTIEDLCFYKMEGKFYVKTKSSLTRKRVLTDPAFEGSRRSSKAFGEGSAIASRLYKQLPKESKSREVFRNLAIQISSLIRDGYDEAMVQEWFSKEFFGLKEEIAPVVSVKKVKKKLTKVYFNKSLFALFPLVRMKHKERKMWCELLRGPT